MTEKSTPPLPRPCSGWWLFRPVLRAGSKLLDRVESPIRQSPRCRESEHRLHECSNTAAAHLGRGCPIRLSFTWTTAWSPAFSLDNSSLPPWWCSGPRLLKDGEHLLDPDGIAVDEALVGKRSDSESLVTGSLDLALGRFSTAASQDGKRSTGSRFNSILPFVIRAASIRSSNQILVSFSTFRSMTGRAVFQNSRVRIHSLSSSVACTRRRQRIAERGVRNRQQLVLCGGSAWPMASFSSRPFLRSVIS